MKYLIHLGVKKALQSKCTYKVSSIALNSKGDVLGTTINSKKICRKGGSNHAEMQAWMKWGKKIKTLVIFRVNSHGKLLPIDPCPMCRNFLVNRCNIKIVSIQELV